MFNYLFDNRKKKKIILKLKYKKIKNMLKFQIKYGEKISINWLNFIYLGQKKRPFQQNN
jgi:exonuclease I